MPMMDRVEAWNSTGSKASARLAGKAMQMDYSDMLLGGQYSLRAMAIQVPGL